MAAGVIPTLTSWDWFIITVALISTGLGLWRGMIRTVFGLAAWVLGIIGAPLVGMMIGEQFGISGMPMWVLYIFAFLLTFMLVRLVGVLFLFQVLTRELLLSQERAEMLEARSTQLASLQVGVLGH